MDFADFDALSFDCYGTLIDWEAGIASVLSPWAAARRLTTTEEELLTRYAGHEAAVLRDEPTILYPAATAKAFAAVGRDLGAEVSDTDLQCMSDSVPGWPAFPDSESSLRALAKHYKLIILSNIDNASFRAANKKLGVEFTRILTAEDIGSYKPNPANFDALGKAVEELRIPKERLLHVAQSLFHDHVPAQQANYATVWIDRRHDRPGWGATPPPKGDVAPEQSFTSMASFAGACSNRFEEVH